MRTLTTMPILTTTPARAIRATADAIVKSKQKVSSLVYVGHGETSGLGLLPRKDDPLSLKDALEAARLEKGGAFVATGCQISKNADVSALRDRGVHVFATDRYYWTSNGGQVALGSHEKREETYVNPQDQRLKEVTGYTKTCKGSICTDEELKDPTTLQNVKNAEAAVKNGTP